MQVVHPLDINDEASAVRLRTLHKVRLQAAGQAIFNRYRPRSVYKS